MSSNLGNINILKPKRTQCKVYTRKYLEIFTPSEYSGLFARFSNQTSYMKVLDIKPLMQVLEIKPLLQLLEIKPLIAILRY